MRKIKDIPKTFLKSKVEFDRLLNLFWSSRRGEDGNKVLDADNLGVLYITTQEFMSFAEHHFHTIGNQVLELMENLNTKELFLYDYGKVIRFDEEAQWLFVEEISTEEWKKHDIEQSTTYAESKKSGKEKK